MGPSAVDSSVKANLSQVETWKRLLFMILFAVLFNVAELVVAVVVVVQFLFKLISGSVNEQLQAFGRDLATYIAQIIEFLTFNTDDKPFPFGPWPGSAPQAAPSAATKPAPAKRPKASAAKKTTAKKKADQDVEEQPPQDDEGSSDEGKAEP